jgi:hypothetical protein
VPGCPSWPPPRGGCRGIGGACRAGVSGARRTCIERERERESRLSPLTMPRLQSTKLERRCWHCSGSCSLLRMHSCAVLPCLTMLGVSHDPRNGYLVRSPDSEPESEPAGQARRSQISRAGTGTCCTHQSERRRHSAKSSRSRAHASRGPSVFCSAAIIVESSQCNGVGRVSGGGVKLRLNRPSGGRDRDRDPEGKSRRRNW